MQSELTLRLVNAACTPYRVAGYIHHHWARGKLGQDPVFTRLLEPGTLARCNRVLVFGCGRDPPAKAPHLPALCWSRVRPGQVKFQHSIM